MNYKKNDVTFSMFIEALLLLIILILLLPFITYWCGYFDGWLAMKLLGAKLTDSLNIAFNTNFVPEDLPHIGGVIGWIAGFFTGIKANKNKE